MQEQNNISVADVDARWMNDLGSR